MNIKQRFSYFLGILVYKCLNNLAPEYLSSLLTYVSDTQPYPTRTAINKYLALPKPKLSLMKQKAFSILGPPFGTLYLCIFLNLIHLSHLNTL